MVSQNSKKLNAILSAVSKGNLPLDIPDLPLDDLEQLESFEDYLNGKENFRNIVKYLYSVGGDDISSNVRNILKTLMTNKLAEKFNWKGKGEKEAFGERKTQKVLFAAVKAGFGEATMATVKHAVQEWLKR